MLPFINLGVTVITGLSRVTENLKLFNIIGF